ncbi:MAG: Hpt domain-containing protein [Gammaproteobacteria bacterium]|nr:Hpt domain-containing protein [Gammaproteobacteria bacterium]
MSTTARSESFHLVGEQVAATLHDAHIALEGFADGDSGADGLDKCVALLHSARGALQLAEVYGASLLAEEMELTCQSLAEGKQKEQWIDEGIEALSRAMVQLPAYVERIMGGGRDIPLVLLPLLNDLRAARGNPLLSESTLLLLNLEPPTRSEEKAPERDSSGEDIMSLLAKARPQFQLGLLGWIKNSESEVDLQRMVAVADRLERAAQSEEVHQLWWVVGGVLEALIDKGLEASIALKRLIGQADREIKRLQENGEEDFATNLPTDLVNNLLYYVARSRSGGKRCDAIRSAFNLSDAAPGDEQVEELREHLSAPSARLMKTVANAIREDLGHAKDVLDIYVRTGMKDSTDLEGQVGLLRKIGDTMGVLGLGPLREAVQQRSEELAKLVAAEVDVDEQDLITFAAALLDVEQRLDTELLNLVYSDEEGEEPRDAEFNQVTEAVMRECIVNLTRIKETITQTLANSADMEMVDSLADQFRGISAGLIMLGKTRAVDTLGRIGVAIRKCVENESVAREPAYLNRLADAFVSLEYYMETLQTGRKEPVYMLDNAERCLDVIEESVPLAITESEEPHSHTTTLKIDPDALAGIAADVTDIEKTSIIEVPVLQTGTALPDPELLETFIEEAREEIAAISRHYPVWVENQADEEALITLRRSFHTLKGSGRMVGAEQIGEYSWSMEDILNRVINKTVEVSPGLIAFVGDAVEALPQLLEQLEIGTDPTADLEAITNDAGSFAAGGIAERYAGVAAPAEDTAELTLIKPEELDFEATLVAAEEPTGMDPVLLDILTRETATHLAAIRKFLGSCRPGDEPFMVTEAMHRACHTLQGSVTMADAQTAAVITDPLYQLVEQLYRQGTGLSAADHSLCEDATNAVEAIIAHLADPASESPDTEQVQSDLLEMVKRLAAEKEEKEAQGESPTLEAPGPGIDLDKTIEVGSFTQSAEELAEATGDADEGTAQVPVFDAEIAAIFIEEAGEILEAADVALAGLAENSKNSAPLAELQRHLHTLKGGARMAGIVVMGDFSHELESLLIRINQGGMGLDESAYGLLQASIDELHRMREQVPGGLVEPPGDKLVGRLMSVVEATMMMPVISEEDKPLAEEDIDQDSIEDTRALSVPEPEGLGELARELTRDAGPRELTLLPEDMKALTAEQAPERAPRREIARVDSAMLENLLNNAGEISIFHSRLNQQLNSIQFNLDELGTTVRRLQQQLRNLDTETEAQILFRHQGDINTDDEDFDPLELDRYSTIQQLSRGLTETASDVSSIKDLLQNIAADTESILSQQARTTSEMQDSLMRTRMVPFDQHVPRLSRLVRQQAVESGKQVELRVEGSAGELDRQVMEKMLPPFEHMLRNAIIHGVEDPKVRKKAGKPADAVITIRFGREGSQVLIEISDDGAGVNLDDIRAKAAEQGLIKPDQELTDEEVMQLILHIGLSTADKLTQSAGRGIGMDVVVSEIAKLGGTLAMHSEAGKGSTFTVRLPYTLAITQAFIVKAGGETFALPLPTVEGVVRIGRKEFEEHMAEPDPMVEYGDRNYRIQYMGLYLGLGTARLNPDDDQVTLILVEAGESSTALISDEAADSREIVVKPIGSQLSTIRGLAGATILGDGRIVVILDAGALVRSAVVEVVPEKPARVEEEDLPALALVVDDSITMRRVTQRLLERIGMHVLTAKDGIEALEVLQDHIPDIVFLDVEMPRMDGYEFAGHVRNNPETADLPIIMVTSRAGEKHRARAIELGVNDYLGKPYQEHEMLEAMQNLLGDSFNEIKERREHDVVS